MAVRNWLKAYFSPPRISSYFPIYDLARRTKWKGDYSKSNQTTDVKDSGIKRFTESCFQYKRTQKKSTSLLVSRDGLNSGRDIYVWTLPSLRVLLLFVSSLSSIIMTSVTTSERWDLASSFVSSLGLKRELRMTTRKRTIKEATKNTLMVEATSVFGRDDSILAERGASFFAPGASFARGRRWEVDEFAFFAFLPSSEQR